MDHYRLLIGGELVDGADGARAESIDPGTGQPVATYARAGRAEAEQAVEAAQQAYESGRWSGLAPEERARMLMDLADRLAEKTRELGLLEALDSGGLVRRTGGDIVLGARLMRNLARYAAFEFPWEEELKEGGLPMVPGRHLVRREPMGVCVGIIPWNFPFVMANWKITMAAAMGNTVVLKPASDTPLSALALGRIVAESDVPPGVINIIAGAGDEVGETLCTHPHVAKVAFTGSTEVGRRIMTLAAGTIKKVTLELGGKSPNIVLDDADLDSAVDGALLATFLHSGQICESGTRLLLPESRYDEIMDPLIRRAESIRVGYQLEPRTKMGPVVSQRQLETVESYVRLGKEEGAELATGGQRVEVEGFAQGVYYAPTIFGRVKNQMRIAQEEIFGPVLSVIPYRDEDEAVALANDSIYGLGGGVWSRDVERARRVANRVRTGTLWINDYHVFSDLCPFGGYKQSGVGRELGHQGLAEYTEVKHVHLGAEGHPVHRPANRLLLSYPRATSFTWTGPTQVVIGVGRAARAGEQVRALGGNRALVISDPGIQQAGLLDPVSDALGDLQVALYTDVPQDSGLDTVDAATDLGREHRADIVVSVGGGSVIDTAKAVAVCLGLGGRAVDHLGIQLVDRPPLPHLVIPTTAGTGSEVSNSAVLHDRKHGRKVYIVSDRVIPEAAILDPHMTAGLPATLTASTGMDALTHAVEAVVSRQANPISDGQALQAIRMIATDLPRCIDTPDDLEARVRLQQAATMAGWAFTMGQLGLVHGMSHALGARCGVPHGTGNGILLPHVMRWNAKKAQPQLDRITEALGGSTDKPAADLVADLLTRLGHPTRLSEVGVTEADLEPCADLCLADVVILTNPRAVVFPQQIVDLYRQAL